LIFLFNDPTSFYYSWNPFCLPFSHHYRNVMGCYYTELLEINLRILWLYLAIFLNDMFRIT
jgi:hypothetical protein